ncbi:MAG: hypothetical protein ABJV68_18045 [Paracoccaceae bacterium]
MKNHKEIQKRLKAAIQNAILETGRIEGTDSAALTNTDVVDALLEITGLWASGHNFDTLPPSELAFKHALTIMEHIAHFQPRIKSGELPFNVVSRNKVN